VDIDITEVEYHRNGSSGEGFYACGFRWSEGDGYDMIAVVFLPEEEWARDQGSMTDPAEWPFHNPRVAVLNLFDMPDLSHGYRGDYFAPALYAEIFKREQMERERLNMSV
jgi:hypothetical protein